MSALPTRAVFEQRIIDFWDARLAIANAPVAPNGAGAFSVAINPELSAHWQVILLDSLDGIVRAAVTPAVADKIDLRRTAELSESSFRRLLNETGIALHDADCLFYFGESAKRVLLNEQDDRRVRRLTAADGVLFESFQTSASEQDLDDAFVELDHWAVFGSFEGDRLVSVASMYPWGGGAMADIGVLTLPDFRGRGHARAVVRASSRFAFAHDYTPQYRCQVDNHGSLAVAGSAGLTMFGKWEVATDVS